MIGPGTTIRGNVSGDEDLEVQGRVEGALRLSKDLEVSEGAVLEADVEARSVHVAGRIAGNVTAPEALVVEAGATVVGDVTTQRLMIAEGAHFKGRVHMDFDLPGATDTAKRRR